MRTFEFQKLFNFALFATLMLLVHPGMPLPILAAAFLLIFVQERRIELLALFNLFFGVLGVRLHAGDILMPTFGNNVLLKATLWNYAGAYLATLGFFYLYAHATRAISRGMAIFLLLLIGVGATLAIGHFGLLANAIVLLLLQGIFWNVFYVRTRTPHSGRGWAEFLACQQPFHMRGMNQPIPPMLANYFRVPAEPAAFLKNQRGAIQLMLIIVLLDQACTYIFQHGPSYTVLSSIRDPRDAALGLNYASLLDFSLGERWVFTVGTYVRFLSWLTLNLGIPVAFYRIMGVELSAPVYKLFSARSLFDFFEKTNHYYCRLIVDIYIYPIYQKLNVIKTRARRFQVAAFAGILIGGLTYHSFVISSLHGPLAKAERPSSFSAAFVYWICIALLTSASFATERNRPTLEPAPKDVIRRAATWIIYFLLSSVLFLLVVDFSKKSLSLGERFHFLLSLFGI